MFNVSTSVRNNIIKIHKYETNINLMRIQKRMCDIFNLKIQPLSESVSILSFACEPCEIEAPTLLPTGVTNLDAVNDKVLCLRKIVKGVMGMNLILELSLVSKISNFISGHITFHVNLCLSSPWFTQLFNAGVHEQAFHFVKCTESKNNFGEDYLVWKSNFSSDLFLFSGNRILIYLPGKTFNSELKIDDNTLSGNGFVKCSIQYRWNTKGSKYIFDHKTYPKYRNNI